MMQRKLCLMVVAMCLYFTIISVHAQHYPINAFRSPMDTPLYLSAPFGSLRDNHFHSGMDIRTYEKTGLPIYAIADGYVSRVKYASSAYGKAIYITHPNGFTSVYAHLENAHGNIATYIRNHQYKNETFEFDHFPEANRLPVKKGDTIGWSGNTGTSTGPHLHFEIRHTQTEEIINPQLFGIYGFDTVRPFIKSISAYTLNPNRPLLSHSFQFNKKHIVNDSSAAYSDTIYLPKGNVGFATDAIDYLFDRQKEYSIYALELYVDEVLHYRFKLDRFSFDQTRYINAHIDFERYKKENTRHQKLFRDDGNQILLYPFLRRKGKYNLNDTLPHSITIKALDFNGRSFSGRFWIKANNSEKSAWTQPYILKNSTCLPARTNELLFSDLRLTIPSGALYDTTDISITTQPAEKNMLSPVYVLSENNVPLHKNMTIAIKLTNKVKIDKPEKVLLCARNKNGSYRGIGGELKNAWVSASTNTFGDYFIGVDTVAPIIKPVNINAGNVKDTVSLKFNITDDISGICCYKGYINGKWELFEYDAKNNLIEYFFHPESPTGKLDLEIIVWDKKENQQSLKITINR